MRVKTVSIAGIQFHYGRYVQYETEIDGKLIEDMSITTFQNRMKINMLGSNGITLKELFVPDTFIVEITYKDI